MVSVSINITQDKLAISLEIVDFFFNTKANKLFTMHMFQMHFYLYILQIRCSLFYINKYTTQK